MTSAASSVVVFMSVSIMLGALSLFLVLIGLIGFLIYQTRRDGWNLQPFQALATPPGAAAQRAARRSECARACRRVRVEPLDPRGRAGEDRDRGAARPRWRQR